jgi:nuclease-like protein
VKEREEIDPGIAGQSARHEAERIRARKNLEKSSRSRLAAVLLGPTSKERQLAAQEQQWSTGARGEEMLAQLLSCRCPDVAFLHDRRMPRSRANIDHIAVCASGAYVIDAKRYRGKIDVRTPLFGKPKLLIAGRDRTGLVEGLHAQVAVVRALLADIADGTNVHGCLCFMAPEGRFADSGLPAVRTLKINGYPLYYPRRLARRLNRTGALAPEQVVRIHAELARRLRPA